MDLIVDIKGSLTDVAKQIKSLDQEIELTYMKLSVARSQLMNSSASDEGTQEVMTSLSELEEQNTSVRRRANYVQDTLIDIRRSRGYTAEEHTLLHEYLEELSCIEHNAEFLADRIDFLMSTSVGFININQNKAIKKLSKWTVWIAIPALIFAFFSMNILF